MIFNLVMAGELDVFDRLPCMESEIKEGEKSFSMSRMLEGTPSDIYSKLIPVRPNTLKALTMLPVLFMTEAYMKDDENDKLTRIARDIATTPQRYNFEFPVNWLIFFFGPTKPIATNSICSLDVLAMRSPYSAYVFHDCANALKGIAKISLSALLTCFNSRR